MLDATKKDHLHNKQINRMSGMVWNIRDRSRRFLIKTWISDGVTAPSSGVLVSFPRERRVLYVTADWILVILAYVSTCHDIRDSYTKYDV